jgi:hypothetical protein
LRIVSVAMPGSFCGWTKCLRLPFEDSGSIL